MTTDLAEKVKRTRTMGVLQLEQHYPDGWGDVDSTEATTCPIAFGTALDAEKWLRAHGEEGKTYRLIRRVWETTIKVETVRKIRMDI